MCRKTGIPAGFIRHIHFHPSVRTVDQALCRGFWWPYVAALSLSEASEPRAQLRDLQVGRLDLDGLSAQW